MKNAERNARIIEMRKAGMWPREIAVKLGVTRSVVIGVTNRAGMADSGVDRSAIMKAVAPRGQANPRAIFDDDAVRQIRQRYVPYSRSDGALAMARELGCSFDAVYDVVRGRTWAHVQ